MIPVILSILLLQLQPGPRMPPQFLIPMTRNIPHPLLQHARSRGQSYPHSRGNSGHLPTIVFFYMVIIIITTSFWSKKMVIYGLAFPAFMMPVRLVLRICSVFLNLPVLMYPFLNWEMMSGTTMHFSDTGAGISPLNNPVHFLIQTLCIAVCHSADIICHQKQAEI